MGMSPAESSLPTDSGQRQSLLKESCLRRDMSFTGTFLQYLCHHEHLKIDTNGTPPPPGFEFPDRRLTDERFALPISHTSGREVTQDQCDYVDSMFCGPLSRLTSWLVRGPLGLVTHCQPNA